MMTMTGLGGCVGWGGGCAVTSRTGRHPWVMLVALTTIVYLGVSAVWMIFSAGDAVENYAGVRLVSSRQHTKPDGDVTNVNDDVTNIFGYIIGSNWTEDSCYPGDVMHVLDSKAEIDRLRQCRRLVYNRVPKCGSRAVLSTFRHLASSLNYTFLAEDRLNGRNYVKPKHIPEFLTNISSLPPPFLYARHVHFIDFQRFGFPAPLYINVIRDPLERLVSHYYYNIYGSHSRPLTGHQNMTLDQCVRRRSPRCMELHEMLPFFSGHKDSSRHPLPGNLERAMASLGEHFSVVGFTEDLPAFMEVLEALLPAYFQGAALTFTQLEHGLLQRYSTVKKLPLSPRTRAVLLRHLAPEYEFYHFARQRFYTLLEKVRSNNQLLTT